MACAAFARSASDAPCAWSFASFAGMPAICCLYQARISVLFVGLFAPLACALFTLAAPSGLRGRVRDGLPVDMSLGGRWAVEGAEFVRPGFAGVADGVVVLGFESTELPRRGGCGV